jgi:L-ascorbate metabolism protein UlaG (beta-lactamase superfamily)
MYFILGFLIFIAACALAIFAADRFFRTSGWHGEISGHFNGRTFVNMGEAKQNLKRGNIWKWLATRPKNAWVWRKNSAQAKPAERVEGSRLVVTMVNHATLLIQTEGLNILTDPIWSERTSPFTWLGPKRYRAPGIAFENLPPIDLVLISHNHYDHMDIRTLAMLKKRFDPEILCGLGNKAFLADRGLSRTEELDWWERHSVSRETTIVFVPAQHFSARAISDRNNTLWGGFVIETAYGNIYFAGDTGYGPYLDALKERYKNFRLALIPIGAYLPDFIMQPVHLSPAEAYRAAGELNAQTMIPMHYATFRLADDGQDQPLQDLDRAMRENPNRTKVAILSNGETFSGT